VVCCSKQESVKVIGSFALRVKRPSYWGAFTLMKTNVVCSHDRHLPPSVPWDDTNTETAQE
jgi:hypothetical protein